MYETDATNMPALNPRHTVSDPLTWDAPPGVHMLPTRFLGMNRKQRKALKMRVMHPKPPTFLSVHASRRSS